MMSTPNIILNGGKNESIPHKIRNKTWVSIFTTIIQHSSGSPSYSNQRRKRNKKNIDQKRISKDSIRKFPERISEFSKVAGHKINTQTLLAFLYAKNEKSEREFKKSILFTIAAKRIKNLGANSTETKELYTESYRTIMIEIKDDINKRSDIP